MNKDLQEYYYTLIDKEVDQFINWPDRNTFGKDEVMEFYKIWCRITGFIFSDDEAKAFCKRIGKL